MDMEIKWNKDLRIRIGWNLKKKPLQQKIEDKAAEISRLQLAQSKIAPCKTISDDDEKTKIILTRKHFTTHLKKKSHKTYRSF